MIVTCPALGSMAALGILSLISGLGQTEKLPIGTEPKLIERTLTVRPGTHNIKCVSDAEPLNARSVR